MPQKEQKRTRLFSLLIAAVVGLLTIGLAIKAVTYAVILGSTFFCTGWNEGSMHVASCSIPGIESYADSGNELILRAWFFFGLPFLIPGIIAFICSIYWFIKLKLHPLENYKLPPRSFVLAGLIICGVSTMIFIGPVIFFVTSLLLR